MKCRISLLLILLCSQLAFAEPSYIDSLSLKDCNDVAIKNSSELKQAYSKLQAVKVGASRSMWDVLRPSLQVGPTLNPDGRITTTIGGGVDLLAPFGPYRWQKKTNNIAIQDVENEIRYIRIKINHDISEAWNIHRLNLSKLNSLKDMSKLLHDSLQQQSKSSDISKVVVIFLLRDADIRIMDAEKDILGSRSILTKVMQLNEE